MDKKKGPAKNEHTMLSFRVSSEMADAVRARAWFSEVSFSELMRDLIRKWLTEPTARRVKDKS